MRPTCFSSSPVAGFNPEYRPDFVLRAVRRLSSRAIVVVSNRGEVLTVGGRRRSRWLGGRRFWRALHEAGGARISEWDKVFNVVGADARDEEDVVVCVDVYEKGMARMLAEAVVESSDAGETWRLRAFRRTDATLPRARVPTWCDVAFAPR